MSFDVEGGARRRVSWRRVYRLALRVLPAELRSKHGRAMEDLFARELELARRAGLLPTALAGLAGVRDVVRRGLYERTLRRGSGAAPVDTSGKVRWSLDPVIGDLRESTRSLRRAPTFTLTAVLILGLGIGSATAVFTGFRAVVLEDLPVTDPDRLITLSLERQSGGAVYLNRDEIDALGRESRTLQGVAGIESFGAEAFPLTGDERSLVLNVSWVTPNFFQVLGVRPVHGRLLRPEDGEEGAARVTVISHKTWQREFGGDPGVVGRHLTRPEYGERRAIVGIAPAGLDYPIGADYWIPAARSAMTVVARLAPDVTPAAARAEFLSIVQVLDGQRTHPRSPAGATVQSLSAAVLGDARPILLAIAAAVALLLLIVCVNVGNLLLMRATERSRDVLVRRALGATSGRIARLFLAEGALLGAAGGVLGLTIAVGLLHVFPTIAPVRLPRAEMMALAGGPVAVAMAVTVLSVLLISVVPAMAVVRGDPASALRSRGHPGTGTKRRRRVRQSLVAMQVALAVVMLVGAGLLLRSLQRLAGLELGYDTEGVAIVELVFNRQARPGPADTYGPLDGVLERIRAMPGVTAATLIMARPYMGATGIFEARPVPEGESETDADSYPRVPLEVGDSELFRALGIPIIHGRGLLDTDLENAPRVAVLSQAVAQRLWPGEDPIGRRIRMVTSDAHWWTVVGVAGETRFRHLLESTPTIYLHFRQLQILPAVWTVAVRAEHRRASVLPDLRRVVGDVDPRISVWRVGTMKDHLARGPLAQPRLSALLLTGFAVAALLLAALGLYGVMTLLVRERTHELGVRKALGATATRLRKDVLADALTVTVGGVIAGLTTALLGARMLVTLLYGVGPADPVTLLGVCALLVTVAVVAAYIPAQRATRVDPMRTLRNE